MTVSAAQSLTRHPFARAFAATAKGRVELLPAGEQVE
jgi:hypothetical protein